MNTITLSGNFIEEASANRLMEMSVSLSEPATAPIELGFRLVSGTGLVVSDFTNNSNLRQTIGTGEQFDTFRLSVTGDTEAEFDESLVLEAVLLSGEAQFANGAPLGRATGFILDDDGAANPDALFVSRPVLVEGDSGRQVANFEVTLSRPASQPLEIPWATTPGSATPGEDFVAQSGTLTLVPGQRIATVGVQVIGDARSEPNETFGIKLTPPAAFGDASVGLGTIIDDDAGSGPTVALFGNVIEEAQANRIVEFGVRLSEPAPAPIELEFRLVSGTALVSSDFTNNSNLRQTIPEGSQGLSFRISVQGESNVETDESFVLEAGIRSGNATFADGAPLARVGGFILDDDGASSPEAIFVSNPIVVEGDFGRSEAAFTISLSRPAERNFTIDYQTVSNGSAVPGVDYVPRTGTINVRRGETEFGVAVPIVGDLNPEAEKSFLMSVTPSIALAGLAAGEATIVDTDDSTNGPNLVDGRGSTTPGNVDTGAGRDTILGGFAGDTLRGGDDGDVIEGNGGRDALFGDAGADVMRGGGAADRMVGGSGADRMIGNNGNDTMFGQNGRDVMIGGGGSDVMNGNQGADNMAGGAGADTMDGGGGNDRMAGEAGADVMRGDVGRDAMDGGGGQDRMFGGANGDTLSGGSDVDRLFGGAGRDVLDGGAGNDFLFGGAGPDLIRGGDGRDQLRGDAGDDDLRGGEGRDTLTGGEGNDVLRGQAFADTFVFTDGFGRDVILDFAAANDLERIDLAGVSSIVNFNDLTSNHLRQVGDNTILNAGGGDAIFLAGVRLADLDPADFLFA